MRNNIAAKKISGALVALITWFALILQCWLILQTTGKTGYSTLKTITNFFSYFTILSNILVAVCLSSAFLDPVSRLGSFFSKISVQSAIALYIFIVGLVYNLVLRGIVILTGIDRVADNLLHVVVPVLFVLYWLIFAPKKTLQWKNILPWLIFPGLYLVYSLIRGPVADWYPYPFLNINILGYSKVILNSAGVLVAFLAAGLLLIAYNRAGKGIN